MCKRLFAVTRFSDSMGTLYCVLCDIFILFLFVFFYVHVYMYFILFILSIDNFAITFVQLSCVVQSVSFSSFLYNSFLSKIPICIQHLSKVRCHTPF